MFEENDCTEKSETLLVQFVGEDVLDDNAIGSNCVRDVVVPVEPPSPNAPLFVDEHALGGVFGKRGYHRNHPVQASICIFFTIIFSQIAADPSH